MFEYEAPNSSLQQQMESFGEACRAADLKFTHQRLEIYRELAGASDHPSAEILHKRLQKNMPTLSLDTVYRTLATFEQHHLVKKVETVGSQARFEAQMTQHHHLICDTCKEIMDFQWSSFDGASLPEDIHQWGAIRNKNVTIYGTCRRCQSLKK
ncbi:MAG: Fur family transcriptional regulator [Desulfocapsaceae bacterium]|nr:Fur family transcriptional regulator [Desulfocapsaceae bacterium]